MKTTQTQLRCDVLVAGGGPAGVSCALAAARCGSKTILCQDRPVLGGNASSEVRMHIVGANGMSEGLPLEREAREGGIVEELEVARAVQTAGRVAILFFDRSGRNCCAGANPHTAIVARCRVDRRIPIHARGAAVVQRRVGGGAEAADA